jgi:hypothetical protein
MDELAEIRKAIRQLSIEMSVLFQHIANIEAAHIALFAKLESPAQDKANELSTVIASEMAKQVDINLRGGKT